MGCSETFIENIIHLLDARYDRVPSKRTKGGSTSSRLLQQGNPSPSAQRPRADQLTKLREGMRRGTAALGSPRETDAQGEQYHKQQCRDISRNSLWTATENISLKVKLDSGALNCRQVPSPNRGRDVNRICVILKYDHPQGGPPTSIATRTVKYLVHCLQVEQSGKTNSSTHTAETEYNSVDGIKNKISARS